MTKLKAGDKLWTHNFNYLDSKRKFFVSAESIKKVGRQFITLKDGSRVDIKTLLLQPKFGSSSQYFYTQEEAEDALLKELARIRLASAMQFHNRYQHLTGKQLSAIADALENKAPLPLLSLFQDTIYQWCQDVFGEPCTKDVHERGLRLLEESLETTQALGIHPEAAHRLVDYVYGRPVGQLPQEISGVLVTILALAAASGNSAEACLTQEIERITDPAFREKARNKHNTKKQAGVSGHSCLNYTQTESTS